MTNSLTPSKTKTGIVRISVAAKKHLFKVVDARRRLGLSASGASVLNEVILALPLPEKESKP